MGMFLGSTPVARCSCPARRMGQTNTGTARATMSPCVRRMKSVYLSDRALPALSAVLLPQPRGETIRSASTLSARSATSNRLPRLSPLSVTTMQMPMPMPSPLSTLRSL